AILGYTAVNISGTPLVTIGDAIASFIEYEDATTRGRCLLFLEYDIWLKPLAVPFSPKHRRWCTAATGGRWLLWILLYTPPSHSSSSFANIRGSSVFGICIVAILLGHGILQIKGLKDVWSIWSIGLGAVSQQTLISSPGWPSSLMINTLIANAAQP